MPPKVSPHFLGLQLSVDALRATIVDEQLELVGSEHVDFDAEFPEYQTHGGIHASTGDVYMTSVEIWLKALDVLFERLQRNYDLSKIKAIAGAAQVGDFLVGKVSTVWEIESMIYVKCIHSHDFHYLDFILGNCPVWLTTEFATTLQGLSEKSSLNDQILPKGVALRHVPVVRDTSAAPQALSLEQALGGPDSMANQVGATTHASLLAAQMLHLRDTNPEAWAQTSRVASASVFLCSIMIGKLSSFTEAEAAGTGLYSAANETWDEGVLKIIAGFEQEVDRVKSLLGGIERNGAKPVGQLCSYFSTKYGLDADIAIYPFTSEHLASYLSLAPSSADCVVEFGATDILLTPATKVVPSPFFITVPHPAQDTVAEKKKYISMVMSRNADMPRAVVRDAYTKSWSAFDRLVAVVPPGGSIGLDDKLFSFWILQDENYPFSHIKGVYRFETGIKVNEFRDLRANPRCLLESQILSLRVKLAHLHHTGVFLPSKNLKPPRSSQVVDSIGIKFDPYDTANLPRRILATGSACTFPSVVGLLGDVFNAPVLIPNSLVEQSSPDVQRLPSAARAALGAAYVARWGWRKTSRPDEKHASFEDEVRWLMTKKWTIAGNGPATSGGNRSRSVSAPGSAPGPGSYKHLHAKSGLAASSFAEEDEDEESYESSFGQYSGAVTPPRNLKNLTSTPGQLSTPGTNSSLGSMSGSSANITPNLGFEDTPGTPGGHAPLAPIQPLPTDDADVQLGLVKVAEADHDTFLTYAAIVPEFCRLERMIVKVTLRTGTQRYHSLLLFRLAPLNAENSLAGNSASKETALLGTQGNVRNGRDLQIYAMEAQCPHLGADLSHAEIEDYEDDLVAVCPWHRYDFSLKTGKSETGLRACVYNVEVRQENVDDVPTTLWVEPPTKDESWEMVDVRPVSEAFAETASAQQFPAVLPSNNPSTTESQKIHIPLVPDPPPTTLLEWSDLILNTPNATLKVERTRHAVELFRTGKLKSIGRHKSAPVPPAAPPRESGMIVVDPTKVARRGKGGSLKSRVTMLHALANIEQWAIDLAWDIVARFGNNPNLPHQFYTDFTRMALDEAKHFTLLSNRLNELGTEYGSLPIHSSLWQSASQTSDSLLARLAIIHLVHEARGLDVNPATIAKFRKAGDSESVKTLEIIHFDEITHVTSGHRWFTWQCEADGKEPIATFRALVRERYSGPLKGPFNADDRKKAGMSRDYYEDLDAEDAGVENAGPGIGVAYET